MNTISTAASTNAILAIDLAKYKSFSCIHDQITSVSAFTTFEKTRAELRKLIDMGKTGSKMFANLEAVVQTLKCVVLLPSLRCERAVAAHRPAECWPPTLRTCPFVSSLVVRNRQSPPTTAIVRLAVAIVNVGWWGIRWFPRLLGLESPIL